MIPNPGSYEAIRQGCICEVTGNNYGNMPSGRYFIIYTCPLHGSNPAKLYTCPYCDYKTVDEYYLKAHIEYYIHKEIYYKCSCGFTTLESDAMDYHLSQIHRATLTLGVNK